MKLPYRIIVLGSIIQELSEFISEKTLSKYLFIYCKKYACTDFYDFIPIENYPHCLTAKAEAAKIKGDIRFAKKLTTLEKLSLQKFKRDLEKDMWNDDKILQEFGEYFNIGQATDDVILYHIGYEGVSLEAYIAKLLRNNIVCLCDVRKNPYSQKYGFSKAELRKALSLINIVYVHIPELGIDSSLRQDLKNDSDYYNLLKQYELEILPKRTEAIACLKDLLNEKKRLAITCFEANVAHCHRGKIVGLLEGRYEVRGL
jgi:hypothetical protein